MVIIYSFFIVIFLHEYVKSENTPVPIVLWHGMGKFLYSISEMISYFYSELF
jgi:hypothetical protein